MYQSKASADERLILVEVTDDEWQLVKRVIGIDRGWEAAYRLVSALDLPGQDSPPT